MTTILTLAVALWALLVLVRVGDYFAFANAVYGYFEFNVQVVAPSLYYSNPSSYPNPNLNPSLTLSPRIQGHVWTHRNASPLCDHAPGLQVKLLILTLA